MLYFVHQPGKVGSQTVEASLRASDPRATTLRFHLLSRPNLEAGERVARAASGPLAQSLAEQIAGGRQALEVLRRHAPAETVVFSGVRDPLDFAIAAFFQNLAYFYPDYSSPLPGEQFNAGLFDAEVDRMLEAFSAEFDAFRARAGKPVDTIRDFVTNNAFHNLGEWYDEEFRAVHGVDVFAMDFSKTFERFQTERGAFIIYRKESLQEALPEMLSLLPLPGPPRIVNANVSTDKPYTVLYQAFRERFDPTEEMIDYYYGGRFFRHFYSDSRPMYCIRMGKA